MPELSGGGEIRPEPIEPGKAPRFENAQFVFDLMKTLLEAREQLAAAQVLQDAQAEAESPAEPVDNTAALTSCRNKILGGSGTKAQLLGTVASEPSIDPDFIVQIGFTDKEAAEILNERDYLRSAALALIPVE